MIPKSSCLKKCPVMPLLNHQTTLNKAACQNKYGIMEQRYETNKHKARHHENLRWEWISKGKQERNEEIDNGSKISLTQPAS